MVITTINTSYCSYVHQLSYRLGAPHCKVHQHGYFGATAVDGAVGRSLLALLWRLIDIRAQPHALHAATHLNGEDEPTRRSLGFKNAWFQMVNSHEKW